MSYYQHQHYHATPTSASPAAPIQSSFYTARQRFEQQSQANAAPPHLRPQAYDYRQNPAPPPKHPVQQARAEGNGPQSRQAGQPGPSYAQHQTQPQAQIRQYTRPQSQYGHVQMYQPPYAQPHAQAQAQAPAQPVSAYAPRPATTANYAVRPHSEFNPGRYGQRSSGYSPMQLPMMPPLPMGMLPPKHALALYEASQQQRAQAAPAAQQYQQSLEQPRQFHQSVQQPPAQPHGQSQAQYPQQQQPPPIPSSSFPPQSQFARAPPSVRPVALPISAPPVPQVRTQPQPPEPEKQPTVGTRRPLPQPGQARSRPLSMPPQPQHQGQVPAPQHSVLGRKSSSSSSVTSILPLSSFGSPPSSSLYSPASSVPTSSFASAPVQTLNNPSTINIQPPGSRSPEKPSLSVESSESTQRTPTQRRALPQSPTAPPDLSELQRRRSVPNLGSTPFQKPSNPAASSSTTAQTTELVQPQPPPSLSSDSENDDDKFSVASKESREMPSPQYGILDLPKRNSQDATAKSVPASPQYGILDLPKRNSQAVTVKMDPPSPQYGIKDLPVRTKSIVDRRRAWERAEQGMNEALARPRSKPTSPTKFTSSALAVKPQPKTAPVTPARSPQPQTPQVQQKLPMPVVRQPQPSRTERSPSWTLPTADLEKIVPSTGKSAEQKTSMTLRLAKMTLDEENANSRNSASSSSMKSQRSPLPQTGSVSPFARASTAPQPSSPTRPYTFSTRAPGRSVNIDINLDDPPPASLRRTPSPSTSTASSSVPLIPTIKTPEDVPQTTAPTIPKINLPADFDADHGSPRVAEINVQAPVMVVSPKPSSPHKGNLPVINLPGDEEDVDNSGPMISISAPSPNVRSASVPMPVILDDLANVAPKSKSRGLPRPPSGSASSVPSTSSSGTNVRSRGGGLVCGGCNQSIIGRIVSAMGLRWHPQCFKCCQCDEQLEHVSSYEHDGKPYCHLDYHELFAPQCYSCKTPIIDERFITLDDPALGKRTYHEQHFFCAECGDPFLAPSPAKSSTKRSGLNEINIKGDGAFDVAVDEDGMEVGFTVFRGHPYCEACHVRLRAPKCKACKKSIRDGMRAVEALGGKWCYECFVCEGCQKPFDEPSFFQRDKKPFCEHCFSIILRNEI